MINLPQTEQLVNALVKQNNEQNNYDSVKSGWKNFSFCPEKLSYNDIKVTMRKDFNHQSNSCYKWFRNLIIPKINIVLKSNTESMTTGAQYEEKFENIYAVFSCYKYHENASFNVQQVPMKGQVAQPFILNQKQKAKKKFNQLKLLSANSKNLQFSQSHIQNRKIYYCLCITVCKMQGNLVSQELMTALLMPILVENRKKSLQNRTNKYMKFMEFLPIEFQRPLILPLQENKDDNVFKYCIENHLKNEAQRISQYQNDEVSKYSSDSLPLESPFNNFGAFYLKEGRNSSGDEQIAFSSEEESKNKKLLLKATNILDNQMMEEEDLEKDVILSDDLISALIYLSSKTIRHKIYHPFFLSNRFSQAFDLKIKSDLIENGEKQAGLVNIQKILLDSVFFPKSHHRQSDDLTFKNQPLCLLIKPIFKKQSVDSIFYHKITSQIANYLECIQTNDGLFVGFEEQIPNINEYQSVNFEHMEYKYCYDELSRIPMSLQQSKDIINQKNACQHYEIKINPAFKEGQKGFEENGINIYRTIVDCLINDEGKRKQLKKVKLIGCSSSDDENINSSSTNQNSITNKPKKNNQKISVDLDFDDQEIPNQNLLQINQKIQLSKNQLQFQQSTSSSNQQLKQKSTLLSSTLSSPINKNQNRFETINSPQIEISQIENNLIENNIEIPSEINSKEENKNQKNQQIQQEVANSNESTANQSTQQQQTPLANQQNQAFPNNQMNTNATNNNQQQNQNYFNYQSPFGFQYNPIQFMQQYNQNMYPYMQNMQNGYFQFPQMNFNPYQNGNMNSNNQMTMQQQQQQIQQQQTNQTQPQNQQTQPIGYLTIPVFFNNNNGSNNSNNNLNTNNIAQQNVEQTIQN
ncbi:hypothetical protein ABPG74_005474 [Tetrahymena malaccensis]